MRKHAKAKEGYRLQSNDERKEESSIDVIIERKKNAERIVQNGYY